MATHNAARDHFFTASDGLKLHAKEWGEASDQRLPLVCLPGLARTADDFDDVASKIAEGDETNRAGRRVVALNYRGRGLSDWDKDWRNYDIRVENADILSVLTGLGIHEAHFLGTSRGGLHIMVLAATRPGTICSAILNDIGPVLESKGLARIRGYVGKLPSPKSWADAADMCKHIMSAQFTGLDEDDWDSYARLTFKESDRGFVPRYDPNLMRVLGGLDLSKPLPQLWSQFNALHKVPLMVIRGENSDLLSPDVFEAMRTAHKDAVGIEVPGQGHAPLLRDPFSIGKIADFLNAQ